MSDTDKLRNIALAGHGGSGKTSLAEVLIFTSGTINRLGRVEEGNTAMDFQPEEIKRNSSLSCGFHQFKFKNHYVNLIDTPGDQNFFSMTKICLPAADGVVIVVDGVNGIEFRTEQAIEFAKKSDLSCCIFINKLDHSRTILNTVMETAKDILETKPILTQIPIGEKENFVGIIDLIGEKAYFYEDGKATATDIPSELQDQFISEREIFIENVVEAYDELVEKYLEGEEISRDELFIALKKGTLSGQFMPVLCGSATKNIGIDQLQNFIIKCMPSPLERGPIKGTDESGENEILCDPDPNAPFSAYVFNTIVDPYAGRLSILRIVSGTLKGDGNFYNSVKEKKERYSQLLFLAGKEQKPIQEAGPGSIVAIAKLKETTTGDTICDESRKIKFIPEEPLPPVISFSVSAKNKGDEDKIFSSLARLMEEDVSLKLNRNSETKEILLSGNGLVHIQASMEKLKRIFNVEVDIKIPKIPYRETIKKKVRVQGKHKKQTGGHGQFGDCWIVMEPIQRGKGFKFVDAIVGGSIPKTYIPAVEKGILERCARGILAGYPCTDFKVTLDDGSFHAVDSSEMAFKMAGSIAFKKAVEQANAVLLEPIMSVSVFAPDDYTGDIMGDLNSRRGRVSGMEGEGKIKTINANVPMSEMLEYAPDLTSMTQGRGTFTMIFSHYDEVPGDLSQKIITAANKENE